MENNANDVIDQCTDLQNKPYRQASQVSLASICINHMFLYFPTLPDFSIRLLDAMGLGPSIIDPNGNSLANYAVAYGNTKAIYNLGLRGASFDRSLIQHVPSPLQYALDQKRYDLAEIMNQFKVDLNYQDLENSVMSLLNWAIVKDDKIAAEFLLKKGANPNLADEHGNVLLFYAIQTNPNSSIVSMLAMHPKIDFFKPNKFGTTPHQYMYGRLSKELIDIIEKKIEMLGLSAEEN
jgi:ankyrin repeat protein